MYNKEYKDNSVDVVKKDDIEEDVCDICGGKGFYDVDEVDDDGNVARGVGYRRCECQKKNFNEDDQDDY